MCCVVLCVTGQSGASESQQVSSAAAVAAIGAGAMECRRDARALDVAMMIQVNSSRTKKLAPDWRRQTSSSLCRRALRPQRTSYNATDGKSPPGARDETLQIGQILRAQCNVGSAPSRGRRFISQDWAPPICVGRRPARCSLVNLTGRPTAPKPPPINNGAVEATSGGRSDAPTRQQPHQSSTTSGDTRNSVPAAGKARASTSPRAQEHRQRTRCDMHAGGRPASSLVLGAQSSLSNSTSSVFPFHHRAARSRSDCAQLQTGCTKRRATQRARIWQDARRRELELT